MKMTIGIIWNLCLAGRINVILEACDYDKSPSLSCIRKYEPWWTSGTYLPSNRIASPMVLKVKEDMIDAGLGWVG